MVAEETDFGVRTFAGLLRLLSEHLPISDAFESADSQRQGRWWASQLKSCRVACEQAVTGTTDL